VQVEYQFSDTNLVANDFLTKIMNKDPEGYGEWVRLYLINTGSPKNDLIRKTKCALTVSISSFVCHLILEEDQSYGGDKPTAG
jgi:hypothetical protein